MSSCQLKLEMSSVNKNVPNTLLKVLGTSCLVWRRLHSGFTVSQFYLFPIDDAPESGEVVRTAILVVQIVGVFPYVERE